MTAWSNRAVCGISICTMLCPCILKSKNAEIWKVALPWFGPKQGAVWWITMVPEGPGPSGTGTMAYGPITARPGSMASKPKAQGHWVFGICAHGPRALGLWLLGPGPQRALNLWPVDPERTLGPGAEGPRPGPGGPGSLAHGRRALGF